MLFFKEVKNQVEEENKTLQVSFSEEALKNAIRLKEENKNWQNMPLRLYLYGKGCDGFFYGLSFDPKEEGDLACLVSEGEQSITVITDEKTHEFVDGSLINWGEHEGQQGFLVENPKHKRFRGKFYLRGFWRKRLEAANGENINDETL